MDRAARLIVLGYWDRPGTRPGWPRPQNFVDLDWDVDERDMVADYLARGIVSRAYMGYSGCRMCGARNGTLELTDGEFVWPDGLRHYVVDHAVRLPARFVDHVRERIELLETAPRDEAWWAQLR